jgi:hypothetical protein
MREAMRARIQPGRLHSIALCAVGCLFWGCGAARAEDASSWRDIETKYIFGFTTGSGIGLEGEKEFTVDSIGRFGKRDGHYAATETKYEFEFTPSQFIQIEFGALGSTHNIGGVTDLDDRRQVALSGAFAELRYLAIERTSSNPLAVTLAIEPTVRLIDETGGARVRNYEFETIVNADIELLKNRLFAGFNLLYEPEVTWNALGDTQREAKFGGSAALSLPALRQRSINGVHRRRCHAGTNALYPVHAQNVYDGGVEHPGLGTRDRQSRLPQSGGVSAQSRQT